MVNRFFKSITIIIYLFIVCSIAVFGQISDSLILFSGQILSPDSIPIENVYLISYTTLRAFATDKNGEFVISTSSSDSLKVHHVSFESIILKPKTSKQLIYLTYRENTLDEVVIRHNDRNLVYMNQNMEMLKFQLSKEYYYYTKPPGNVVNTYAPTKSPSGILEINFIELFERAVRYKKTKKQRNASY